MHNIEETAERIRHSLDAITAARDKALAQTRMITRYSAYAIRAIHRDEDDLAQENLEEARRLVRMLREDLVDFPSLYYAGYTQDALKEYAEASITCALVKSDQLPSPEELDLDHVNYLQGLAETTGELRRRCLDILRHGHSSEAERLLSYMDDIYAILITMDYPSAVTGGLRRLTDIVRGVTERTRGDITISLRQEKLQNSLKELEDKFNKL
jgi:translin